MLQSIGIKMIATTGIYKNIADINIDANDAARGPVVFVWNSLTYEKADAWTPDTLKIQYSQIEFIFLPQRPSSQVRALTVIPP